MIEPILLNVNTRRDVGNPKINAKRKPASLHLKNQQGSNYYGSLKGLSGRYDSQVNSVGQLDAKKLATSDLLYLFILGFVASLLHTRNIIQIFQVVFLLYKPNILP